MKLLSETEERMRKKHLDKFYGKLRNFQLFESLDDGALYDLAELLELRTYPKGKIMLKKGDPGSNLYILLGGKIGVIADDGERLAEMGRGEAALLSIKNFKHVLKKYPVLQLFLLKMLVDRAQAMALRSGNITSGMSGELDEISMVELFQLINSSQKTGIIELLLDDAKATVYFVEGEFVQIRYRDLVDKKALFALLAKKDGHFSYTKGIPLELEDAQPFGGFMGLIMEGVQYVDEQEFGENPE